MRSMHWPSALALGATLLASVPTHAASDQDIADLRREIGELRAQYEARIGALEAQLKAAQREAAPAVAPEPASAPVQAASPASANSFNPEISLILSGTATHTTQQPSTYQMAGFLPSGGEMGPPSRGFSLGESELGLAANIDPDFRGYINLALTPDNEARVEEAAIQTLALPAGLKLKAGRFLSGIGYLNEQHAHTWDFVDAPLAYQAFLGGQFADDGLQVKWLAPTDVYLEFGAEIGAGRAFPGSGGGRNGAGARSLFVHAGDDWNESHSWRAGFSWLSASPRNRVTDALDVTGAPAQIDFSGASNTLIADFVWKWSPNGNAKERSFKLQAEYFRRHESGTLGCAGTDPSNAGVCGNGLSGDYRATQSGAYAQAVYQFMPRWRIGVRYDRLDAGSPAASSPPLGELPALAPYTPTRTSAMIDFSPSEFGRLRLQWASDKARDGATDQQIFLQYLMSLGAHGAHLF